MTIAFFVVLAITCVERLVELVVGTRNRTWSLAQGGIEYGQGHWPWMVTLHTVFLLSMAAEVLMLPNLGFKMNRWCAVHLSGTLHHVKLFFDLAPGNFAVVANANQQAASI